MDGWAAAWKLPLYEEKRGVGYAEIEVVNAVVGFLKLLNRFTKSSIRIAIVWYFLVGD